MKQEETHKVLEMKAGMKCCSLVQFQRQRKSWKFENIAFGATEIPLQQVILGAGVFEVIIWH